MKITLKYNRRIFYALPLLLFSLVAFQVRAQTTYYTSNSAPQPLDWDDPASWTLNSDGSGGGAGVPGQTDNVFILSGHEVIVDNINDNGGPAQSANGLDLPNVARGPSYPGNDNFPDCRGRCHPYFWHPGDV